jgi:hypothetical protein
MLVFKQIFTFFEGHCLNPLELGSGPFPRHLCLPEVLIKDPIVWLDGARPPLLSRTTNLTIIGLYHPLDGIANPRYTSLCFFK